MFKRGDGVLSGRERTSQLAVTRGNRHFFCSFLQRQLAPPKFDRFKDKQAGISRYTARAAPYLHTTEGARDRIVGRERAWWWNAFESRENEPTGCDTRQTGPFFAVFYNGSSRRPSLTGSKTSKQGSLATQLAPLPISISQRMLEVAL